MDLYSLWKIYHWWIRPVSVRALDEKLRIKPAPEGLKLITPEWWRNSMVHCIDRNAYYFSPPPLHLLIRLENWIVNKRDDFLEWCITHGYLVGPEGGFYSEFKWSWPHGTRGR